MATEQINAEARELVVDILRRARALHEKMELSGPGKAGGA